LEAQMADQQIRFDDGAAYEQMMGTWSRLAGNVFLDWLEPPSGLRWIDVGCGNGAFTELVIERCAPAEVHGVDPSEGQLAFARARPAARMAVFHKGDAMALPFPDNKFDAATMALVIIFVPDPAKGIAEMARVVRPGGLISSYAWDMLGGGFPQETILHEMRAMGMNPARPPQMGASRMDTLRALWANAGLEDVETREITVQRTFLDFENYWATNLKSSSVSAAIAGMAPDDAESLKRRVQARLTADVQGRIVCDARAHAIRGRLPGI
jgi:ubiquinone/menaquinone biosynthesis C-methylase UbiE